MTPADETRFAQLYACFLSGQMSHAQWVGHLNDEPGLKEYAAEMDAWAHGLAEINDRK